MFVRLGFGSGKKTGEGKLATAICVTASNWAADVETSTVHNPIELFSCQPDRMSSSCLIEMEFSGHS